MRFTCQSSVLLSSATCPPSVAVGLQPCATLSTTAHSADVQTSHEPQLDPTDGLDYDGSIMHRVVPPTRPSTGELPCVVEHGTHFDDCSVKGTCLSCGFGTPRHSCRFKPYIWSFYRTKARERIILRCGQRVYYSLFAWNVYRGICYRIWWRG